MSGLVAFRLQARSIERAIGPTVKRLEDMTPVMKKGVGLIRSSVAAEFLNREWRDPNGGRHPWARNVPFGSKGLSTHGGGEKKPLIDEGRYFRALVQGGSGAFAKVTPRTASVGVEIAAFPYAAFIRGGVGAVIRLSPLIIKAKTFAKGHRKEGPQQYAMFWYCLLTFGVALSLKKLREGVVLPSRPHLTSNPPLVADFVRATVRYLETGKP